VLHERYSAAGLVIVGQPCNQFGKQEPLDGQALKEHIDNKYKPLWTICEKEDVNGKDATELYKFLQSHKNCKGTLGNKLKWNFTKFLVGKDGVPCKRYSPKTSPFDIEPDIKKINLSHN